MRRAFLDVVPRQQILDRLVRPLQKNATNRDSFVFLPGAPGYAQSVASNGSKRFARVDVTGAKALLAKAGVTAPTVCVLFDPTNPRRVCRVHGDPEIRGSRRLRCDRLFDALLA